MVSCKSIQIRNPKTGRCVSRTGKIGKQILSRRSRSRSRTPPRRVSPKRKSPKPLKSCKSNQVRNPKSGRCVSRTGKIGKQILSRRSRSRSRTPPRRGSPRRVSRRVSPRRVSPKRKRSRSRKGIRFAPGAQLAQRRIISRGPGRRKPGTRGHTLGGGVHGQVNDIGELVRQRRELGIQKCQEENLTTGQAIRLYEAKCLAKCGGKKPQQFPQAMWDKYSAQCDSGCYQTAAACRNYL